MNNAFSFCAASIVIFLSGAVMAAEWSVEPSVSLREEYNDNIRFAILPHPGVWQSRLTPSVKLSSKTEVSEVSGVAQLSLNRYAGDSQVENRNDKFFSFLTRLRSERNDWGMNASFTEDSTSETEQITTGVVAQVRTQRRVLSMAPSWTRLLTERTSIKLDYGYQDVKYGSLAHSDQTSQQIGATLSYQLSEQDQVSLAAIYSTTDYAPFQKPYASAGFFSNGFVDVFLAGSGVDIIAQKTNQTGIQASASHSFSETLKGDLLAGFRATVTEANHSCNGVLGSIYHYTGTFCTGSVFYYLGSPILYTPNSIITYTDTTRGNGYTFRASLEKKFDAASVSGFASRDTNPSSTGLVETDKFGLSLDKSVSETMTGAVDMVSYRTRYISLISPGSRYFTLEPKMSWRMAEQWVLDAGYRYAKFQQDGTANAITSNAVYANLAYTWPKMAISR